MMYSLRQLLADPAALLGSDHPIALEADASIAPLEARHLVLRIDAWEQALAETPETLIGLYLRDSFEFLAALLAIWRLRKQALVPANNLADTQAQLGQFTTALAGDFAGEQVLRPTNSVAGSLVARPLPGAEQAAIVLFTSGSSGAPVPVGKNFAQLETELTALETQWGASLGAAVVTGSVSHHHIYGLLFRLLWPLCSGRVFIRRERDYWEELAQDARRHARLVLVSSPAHLSRIPPLDWSAGHKFAAIFSSGAPLLREPALALAQTFDTPATEVYGSTETGGIAWRQQTLSAEWCCLPGVDVRLQADTALLEVRSAHLADSHWYTTSDQASLSIDQKAPDNHLSPNFQLCGRADRIAKVGGKRISLSAIERSLQSHPWVSAARVLELPERAGRLGALLVLTNEGNAQLVDQGKNAVNQLFKTLLETAIDRVAIPRYWRYLGELPRNAQGKTTQAELLSLFVQGDLPRLPELLARQGEGQTLRLELYLPSNLYYFDGHFPGRPVLPGVVQTHWAVHYARECWGDLGTFSTLEAIKFQQIVGPNQRLHLALEYQPEKDKLYFSYTSGDPSAPRHHASGRVVFTRGASGD